MSYCINPWCTKRENPDIEGSAEDRSNQRCQNCGTPLLIQKRYRLIRPLREIDEWEPSEIFEVDDLGQPKVLKLLKKKLFQPQFEREVRTLQQLEHAGIPKIEADGWFTLAVGDREIYCLVMEKIQGVNLDQWLQDHAPINQATAVDWMHQLTDLLQQLHSGDLFHRDIKLSNIMLRPTGQLALIDFGTVRPMTNTYFAKVGSKRDITSVVSSGYTPLEQINGKAVPQSDFYALGRSMVHLLTGKHPVDLHEDESTGKLSWRKDAKQPLSDWFVQLLNDMMAPFPGQRPLNAGVVMARLDKKNRAVDPKVVSLIALNVALLVFQLTLGWAWLRAQDTRQQELQGVALTSLTAAANRLESAACKSVDS
ncbi:MAG: serine/threonine-protein kinase [Cyanobacteria bacterium J06560_2]